MDDQNQSPQPNQLEEINIDNLKYSDAAKYFEAATFITQPFVETTNTSWGTRAVVTFAADVLEVDQTAFKKMNQYIQPNPHVMSLLNGILWEQIWKND
jgi:hypothetical protein